MQYILAVLLSSLALFLLSCSVTLISASASEDSYAPKTELFHSFKSSESRPIFIFPLVFTGAIIATLIGLIYILFIQGFVSLELPRSADELLYSVLFHGTIILILSLYLVYWIALNIFQTLSALSLLLFIALLTGNAALKRVHNRKAKAHKE
jgi:hypothetical protein